MTTMVKTMHSHMCASQVVDCVVMMEGLHHHHTINTVPYSIREKDNILYLVDDQAVDSTKSYNKEQLTKLVQQAIGWQGRVYCMYKSYRINDDVNEYGTRVGWFDFVIAND